MTSPHLNNSFSWADALFLYVERPGQPLSIAGVSIFEGKMPLKACRELVESRLPLVPRYRQRVVFPPLNLGLPHWEFDPAFDIRNHIRQVRLRGGTENDLKALASSILSTHLDRQRPLWDLTLVQGLEGNRTGLIARIHHCLADGISGLGMLNVLMDTSPTPKPMPRVKVEVPKPAHRDPGAALLDGLLKSYSSAVKGALMLQSEALNIAEGILTNSNEPLTDLMSIMPELASPAERLPFNVVCHGPQKFGWTEIPMQQVKTVREHCGGTVNDVILAVVSASLRRYSELRGVRVKGRSARIMIPVSVRGNGDAKELGNRISFLPVTIPLDIRDPQKLYAFVQERTEYLKRVRAAEMVGFAGGLFSAIPTPIWAAVGPVASQLPLSLCNIICTNIPGPQMPLYMLGHKMLAWYPYVPIGGEMGFNCAILSYNGKAYFGFTCDVGALPDPENLEKFVDASFAELLKSAQRVKIGAKSEPPHGVKRPARRTKREKKRRIRLSQPIAKPATATSPGAVALPEAVGA
jgi:diacylglycerol O-acyltransferase / wax synthase